MSKENKMKAAIRAQYGPPEVVNVIEIAKPVPKENKILVKVNASTMNRTDSEFRSAEYFISRFCSGLFKPNYQTLGCEFAGVVDEVGKLVTTFKSSDKIFSLKDKTCGGHDENLTIEETQTGNTMPNNMNFEQAAALTEGAHYALVDIRTAQVERGQNVLVYGATGAIGSAAVQLLKNFGAYVTAVGNKKNVALVKSLGADVVIDYQTQDFTKTSTRFHFIYDAVGKSSYKQCKPLLTEKGIYTPTELGKNGVNIWLALIGKLSSGKKLLFPIPTMTKQDAIFLKELAEQNELKPVIDRTYSVDQIVEAYKYVESGQKTGNVIIKIVQ